MYYTYFLKSIKALKHRLELNQNGAVESTKERRPLELIYYEPCIEKADAIRREKYLKIYDGKMF